MTSRVVDDSGHGVPGVFIYAQLQGSPWLAGHAGQVETEVRGYTGPDGSWVLDLTPASALEDTAAWWKIRTYQRGPIGVDVPPAPTGNPVLDVAGYLRPLGPPPEHPEEYVLASIVGVPGGLATLGPDGLLALEQRPPGEAFQSHLHTQTIPATVWGPFTHGFGRYPVAWSLYDATGRECDEYTVQHLDLNTSRVSMDEPTAGLIRMI